MTIVVAAPAGTASVDVTVGFPGVVAFTAPTKYRHIAPWILRRRVTSGPFTAGWKRARFIEQVQVQVQVQAPLACREVPR